MTSFGAITRLLNLSDRVEVLGTVPGGLPHITLPKVNWELGTDRSVDSHCLCNVRGDPSHRVLPLRVLMRRAITSVSAKIPILLALGWRILVPHSPARLLSTAARPKPR